MQITLNLDNETLTQIAEAARDMDMMFGNFEADIGKAPRMIQVSSSPGCGLMDKENYRPINWQRAIYKCLNEDARPLAMFQDDSYRIDADLAYNFMQYAVFGSLQNGR